MFECDILLFVFQHFSQKTYPLTAITTHAAVEYNQFYTYCHVELKSFSYIFYAFAYSGHDQYITLFPCRQFFWEEICEYLERAC